MKVRLSTVSKGRRFVYKGRTYEMAGTRPQKDKMSGSTFRWVKEFDKTGKRSRLVKMNLHGGVTVTLLSEQPTRLASRRSAPAYRRGTQTPKVLLSKGSIPYRVTASWWNDKLSRYESKLFFLRANSAAEAITVVKRQKRGDKKVTYRVARNEEV